MGWENYRFAGGHGALKASRSHVKQQPDTMKERDLVSGLRRVKSHRGQIHLYWGALGTFLNNTVGGRLMKKREGITEGLASKVKGKWRPRIILIKIWTEQVEKRRGPHFLNKGRKYQRKGGCSELNPLIIGWKRECQWGWGNNLSGSRL